MKGQGLLLHVCMPSDQLGISKYCSVAEIHPMCAAGYTATDILARLRRMQVRLCSLVSAINTRIQSC